MVPPSGQGKGTEYTPPGYRLASSIGDEGGRDDVVFEATAPLDEKLIPKGLSAMSEQRTGIAIREPSGHEQRLAFGIDLLALALWVAVLWPLRGI